MNQDYRQWSSDKYVDFAIIAVWGSGDKRSKYNVDISKIVADKIQLPDGRHIAYSEQGVSREIARHNILVIHGFLASRLAGTYSKLLRRLNSIRRYAPSEAVCAFRPYVMHWFALSFHRHRDWLT